MAGESSICTSCGKPVPVWAVAGNCPACLMGGGGSSSSSAAKTEVSSREIIDGWTIGERIGEGAFGVVYAVKQTVPVRREAAMKILRPAMGSKETLARFEVERQALALMNHADIVTIFDAGTTDDGRPYYVMEYVDGEPVTKFAKSISIEERLTLFDRICAVVEHAHLRGVIHRDLKPANILVYRGENNGFAVKLLDFGIAKATEDVLTQSTLITTEGQILGTPEYMSPEQAAGTEVDTRSDVYSLGVILYELLAGRLPFHLESNSLEAVIDFLEQVKNGIPDRPSTVSDERLHRDLDWITRKAIEPTRERRYGSVREIRDDIQRFRENRSISARPPELGYLMKKFFLRHWKAVSFAAVIALSVLSATVISSVMAIRANEASRETADAYSRSDLQSAVTELSREQIPQSIAYLIRALRTKPDNPEATQLLRSIIQSYEIPRLTAQMQPGEMNINAAHFFNDGSEAVILSENGMVNWKSHGEATETSPPLRVGGSHHMAVVAPSKKWLAVGQLQGGVRLIDLENRSLKPLANANSKNGKAVSAIAFSKSDSILAACGLDGITHLWEIDSGKKKWNHTTGTTPTALAISDDETIIAVGYRNGVLEIHDIESGNIVGSSKKLGSPIDELIPISTTELVVCLENGRSAVHALSDGKQKSVGPTWAGDLSVTLFDQFRKILVIATDREILVWPLKDPPSLRRKIAEAPGLLAIHPTDPILAIGSDSVGVQLWNYSENRMLSTQLPRLRNPVTLSFSDDGTAIFAATRDGKLQRYDRDPVIHTENENNSKEPNSNLPLPWQKMRLSSRVGDIDFDSTLENLPDEIPTAFGQRKDFIFAAYRERLVIVWDRESGSELHRIQTTESNNRCLDLTPDGEWLVFGDSFGKAAVIHLPSNTRKPFSLNHDRAISSISVNPVEKKIATASFGGHIRIWDLPTGKLLVDNLQHRTRGIPTNHYCRFSPNGKRLLTWGTADNSVRAWRTLDGSPIGFPIQSPGRIVTSRFHSESPYAVFTANRLDSKIYQFELWSLDRGTPIAVPVRADSAVEFDEIPLPSAQPFSPEFLAELESQIGLRLDSMGFSEILIE